MSTLPQDIDRSLLIEGLGKGLRVMESFSDSHPCLTATEAAESAGLTRTAARRYLVSLVHFGYAETDGKRYWLLPRVLRLAHGYLESARLPRLMQPFLQQLSMQTGEGANVSVLDEHEIVYLARSHSPPKISFGFQVGTRLPAHAVSPGYVLLSALPESQLEAWIGAHEFARFTPSTTIDPRRFREAVAAAGKLGYSSVDQHMNIGLRCVAVPLADQRGRKLAAISISFQVQDYPHDTHITRLLPPLREAAQGIRELI